MTPTDLQEAEIDRASATTAHVASVLARADEHAGWPELAMSLDAALRKVRPDSDWLARMFAISVRATLLADHDLDEALYRLIHRAGAGGERYSSHHGLLCMVVAREAARLLDWPAEQIASLTLASLTMNLSMHKLQDQLALQSRPVSVGMSADILAHPHLSARMLKAAGVADALCIEIVRLHHDDSQSARPLASLGPAQRAARLLHRVDIFTATISRRASRAPMSPVQAARRVCLGSSGVPDEIGSALLKTVGMYPPGSLVVLANGESGIVIARGPRANHPLVGVLVGADGVRLDPPLLRHTHESGHAVKEAVVTQSMPATPPHEALLRLR